MHLITDASAQALGGGTRAGGPLVFLSGKFDPTQRAWPTTDREFCVCLAAHRRFPYLLQGDVAWFTGRQALMSLLVTLANSARRIHWREYVGQFPFRVAYCMGKEMTLLATPPSRTRSQVTIPSWHSSAASQSRPR